jgi:hypothetical protein
MIIFAIAPNLPLVVREKPYNNGKSCTNEKESDSTSRESIVVVVVVFVFVIPNSKLSFYVVNCEMSLSSYRLLAGRPGFDSRKGQESFSLRHRVQANSEAHPASYPMGIGCSFSDKERGRGVMLTTHLHLTPR